MARILLPEELRLLSKVSKLYYESNLTQDEIVDKLQLSRSKVSRLLHQAREEGVVQINVFSPPGVYPDLELQLEKRYGLKDVVIVEVHEADAQNTITRELGVAAAAYLQRVLKENDIIGVSWGSTLNCTVDAMHFHPIPGTNVVQIIGGLGRPESEVHATDLCRRLARLLGSTMTLLPAPGIVNSQQVKEVFFSDRHVKRAFDFFSALTFAIVGIGSPAPDSVLMRDSSIISQKELDEVLNKGAVGDIALRFFDIKGQLVHSELDNRVIGIELDQLSRVEQVVGVAGGPQKVSVLRGALLGRFINVLITDQLTGLRLLEPN